MWSFPRSIASRYWMRSLVPMLKNWQCCARMSAVAAALGISIMLPTSIFSSKRSPRCAQLLLGLLQHGVGPRQLLHAADHRIHHAHLAERAGPQDGAELLLEHLRVLEAEADRPEAEEGVRLVVDQAGDALQRLVAAEVERADDHRLRRERLGHGLVGGKLLLLARQMRAN